ncbi:MAG TPA: GH1 family beta-glucosidase [Propionibacteriaceae bacterium]|nr:GH1 family beta-glucosidase [Propionibacteriaceae bacterium]
MADARTFDPEFMFGAATAAFQIEGAHHTDGRTDSIWDTFCRVPGAVIDGHDGSVACDHYSRYADDVDLMADLGLQTYRFSTSWSRVQPDGGPVNSAGLDFYERLVDKLLQRQVMPWLTLYHWDLPQALEDRGGWRNRDTAYLFCDYAMKVYERLGDRVPVWTTLNEPWCAAFLGYTAGAHAPGVQDRSAGLAAAHHLLLGHGLAVQALRDADPTLSLGITLNMTVAKPADPHRPGDVDAARRVDGQMNRIFLDPIFGKSYPADVLADVAGLGLEDHIRPGDLDVISTPIDALGVNYYHGQALSDRPPRVPMHGEAPTSRPVSSPFPAADGVHSHSQGLPRTAMGWEIQPDGLRELLLRVHHEYSAPAGVDLYVTENGAAFDDQPESDGTVRDSDRVAFLRAHLSAILDARDQGVPVRGYFYWSLLDNFEWAWGYHKRFGIVRVDYETQQRAVKDSGREYGRIATTRSLTCAPAEASAVSV